MKRNVSSNFFHIYIKESNKYKFAKNKPSRRFPILFPIEPVDSNPYPPPPFKPFPFQFFYELHPSRPEAVYHGQELLSAIFSLGAKKRKKWSTSPTYNLASPWGGREGEGGEQRLTCSIFEVQIRFGYNFMFDYRNRPSVKVSLCCCSLIFNGRLPLPFRPRGASFYPPQINSRLTSRYRDTGGPRYIRSCISINYDSKTELEIASFSPLPRC